MLERRAKERSRRLEDAVGMQLFNNGVRGVLEWASSTLANMDSHDPVRWYIFLCVGKILSLWENLNWRGKVVISVGILLFISFLCLVDEKV